MRSLAPFFVVVFSIRYRASSFSFYNEKGERHETVLTARCARGFLTQRFGSTRSRLEFLLNTLAQYCFWVGFADDYGDYGDSCSLRSRFFLTQSFRSWRSLGSFLTPPVFYRLPIATRRSWNITHHTALPRSRRIALPIRFIASDFLLLSTHTVCCFMRHLNPVHASIPQKSLFENCGTVVRETC